MPDATTAPASVFDTFQPLCRDISRDKYQLPGESGPIDVIGRVAAAVNGQDGIAAVVEVDQLMRQALFVPGGRILAGAGSGRNVTLMNCFVMDTIRDDLADIFRVLGESALTMQQGGGIGIDFSSLRPAGARLVRTGSTASGPLTFMDVWHTMCLTIMSAGHRRGAMMATMRCDHPDIEAFIEAKRLEHKHFKKRLSMFNMSVLVTDDFMEAVEYDDEWKLWFHVPRPGDPETRIYHGDKPRYVYKRVSARELWRKILQTTYDIAEPGVIFIDRVNERNNLDYCETIDCTNPCAEQPLPPYGNCNLGAINLARLIDRPWQESAHFLAGLQWRATKSAVRFLDNVLDAANYPLPQLRDEAMQKRRIGLGVMGLANMLQQRGIRYGGGESIKITEGVFRRLKNDAYIESALLAKEKGPFPLYDREKFLNRPFVQELDEEVQQAIAEHGIRNGVILTVAPTGTTSIFAGNVSGGIEPVFAHRYTRHVLEADGNRRPETVYDWGWVQWCQHHGHDPNETEGGGPDYMVTAQDLTVDDHLAVMAAAQGHVDSSISKTINLPKEITLEQFGDVYRKAFDMGLKSCTTYRPNDVTGAVLEADPATVRDQRTVDVPLTEAQRIVLATIPGASLSAASNEVEKSNALWQRPRVLPGRTYKVKPGEHASYITITDREDGGPAEVFITTKDAGVQEWTQTIGRLLSAMMRNGVPMDFVVDELRQVASARGGWWEGGHYHASLPAALGAVLAEHLAGADPDFAEVDDGDERDLLRGRQWTPEEIARAAHAVPLQPNRIGPTCPKCQGLNLRVEGPCTTCGDCGWSSCG